MLSSRLAGSRREGTSAAGRVGGLRAGRAGPVPAGGVTGDEVFATRRPFPVQVWPLGQRQPGRLDAVTNLGLALARSARAVSYELLHAAEAHAENGGSVAHAEVVVMHEPSGSLPPGDGSLPRQLLRAGLLGPGTGGE